MDILINANKLFIDLATADDIEISEDMSEQALKELAKKYKEDISTIESQI